ncbi:non-ribosomal peptide synthetase [Actinocrispum wychmicini]|uniref:Amino acid adenylation domain-containing protein n=1 Tax=Actinocrispum wychmicini TaxID=1213861 RepID=A0A4V2S612_9PSEU|nr:condensation domain-containing protein [Actinocrispum wychmicini]TCO54260.1 amino acid adenylation domain-containing protein [Actinocrispum wychmicini]
MGNLSQQVLFDLSPAQELVWLHERLSPGSRAYNFVAVLTMRGVLDEDALRLGMTAILRRHPGLRLELVAGGTGRPRQRVVSDCRLRYHSVDLSAESDPDTSFDRLLRDEADREFDTYQAPLVRWCLVRVAADEHRLVHSEHHLIHDGRSFLVLMRDLFSAYRSIVSHEPLAQPDPGSYVDYVAMRLAEGNSAERARGLEFWRAELDGATFETPLPGLMRGTPERRNHGAQLMQRIEPALADRLRAAGAAGGHTVFTTMLGLFAEVMRRHSGLADLVIGTAVGNRPDGFEDVVGMFVNTLPLRLRIDPHAPAAALLDEVTDVVMRVLAHQDVPIQQITSFLGQHTTGADNPLFNIVFNQADDTMPDVDVPGLDVRMFEGFTTSTTRNDLDLVLRPDSRRVVGRRSGPAGMDLTWDYDTDRFTEQTVRLLADRFADLLRAYVDAEPTTALAALATAQHQQLAPTDNPTLLDGTTSVPRATDGRDETSLAIVSGATRWTFGGLAGHVERVAAALQGAGVVEGQPVAVLFCRGLDSVVTLLACLRIGAVYCPLPAADPPSRLEALLRRLAPALVVSTEELRRRLTADGLPPVVDLAASEWPRAADVPRVKGTASYIMHTSGSTGLPKPVVVGRAALAHQITALIEAYRLGPNDRVLAFAQPHFDVMLEEVLPTLAAGAGLVVPKDGLLSGRDLVAVAAARGVTVANLPTSYVLTVRDEIIAALSDGRWSPRLIILGGERLPVEQIRGLVDAATEVGTTVMNAYGVAEATITSTVHTLTRDDRAVPLGLDLRGVRTHVVDVGGNPLPAGAVGEIAIAGPTLADGYLDDEATTAARFVSAVPLGGQRVLLTGDRGYRDAEGRLHFLGRTDDQIKFRGYRIEPGEIRWQLLTCPGVRDAYVTMTADHGQLVAYVEPQLDLDSRELRAHLADRLPNAMIPTAFVLMPELPRTPVGKIDRTALPDPTPPPPRAGDVSPSSDLERRVARIWAEVLGLDQVGRTDNFFDLGGHSLLLLLAHARISDELKMDIPVTTLFRFPTVEALARRLSNGADPAPPDHTRVVDRTRLSRVRSRRDRRDQ